MYAHEYTEWCRERTTFTEWDYAAFEPDRSDLCSYDEEFDEGDVDDGR
jgi:hypothetical protein